MMKIFSKCGLDNKVGCFATLLLSACSSQISTGPALSSSTIQGNAMMGPVANAAVTAYGTTATGLTDHGNKLGSSTTDASGNYTLTLSGAAENQPVVLEMSGGTYKEEGSGATVTLSGKTMSTVLPSVTSGSSLKAAIGPLTEIAFQSYQASAQTGLSSGKTLTEIAKNADYQVSKIFGISDIVGTIPANTYGSIPNDATGQYAVVMAAFSKNATDAGFDSAALASAIAKNLVQDGNLSAMSSVSVQNASGQTVSFTPPSLATISTTVSQVGAGTVTLAGVTHPTAFVPPVFIAAPSATAPSDYSPGTTTASPTPSPTAAPNASGPAPWTGPVLFAGGTGGGIGQCQINSTNGAVSNCAPFYDHSGYLAPKGIALHTSNSHLVAFTSQQNVIWGCDIDPTTLSVTGYCGKGWSAPQGTSVLPHGLAVASIGSQDYLYFADTSGASSIGGYLAGGNVYVCPIDSSTGALSGCSQSIAIPTSASTNSASGVPIYHQMATGSNINYLNWSPLSVEVAIINSVTYLYVWDSKSTVTGNTVQQEKPYVCTINSANGMIASCSAQTISYNSNATGFKIHSISGTYYAYFADYGSVTKCLINTNGTIANNCVTTNGNMSGQYYSPSNIDFFDQGGNTFAFVGSPIEQKLYLCSVSASDGSLSSCVAQTGPQSGAYTWPDSGIVAVYHP